MKEKKQSHFKQILGAICSTIPFFLLFLGISCFLTYEKWIEKVAIPFLFYFFLQFFLLICLWTIVHNLIERIIEIHGGEEDEASKY